MKTTFLFASITICLLAAGCSKKERCPFGRKCFKEPDEYVLFMSDDFNKTIEYLNGFSNTAYERKLDSARMNLDSLVLVSARGYAKTKVLMPYKNDSALQHCYQEAFKFIHDNATHYFDELIEVYAKDSNATMDEQRIARENMDEFDTGLTALADSILNEQEKFAKKFGLRMQ